MSNVPQVGQSPVAPTHRRRARYVYQHIDELLFVNDDATPCSMGSRHGSAREDRQRVYRRQKT